MKKKIVNKKIDLGKIFLADKALLDIKNDEFGHSDYAELLLKLVNEQQTPFNIGIFGKWGVGKSSIVNLLKDKLKNEIKKKNIKFIEVKVWKYDEKISLTRKFIVNIAEGLGLSDDLNDLNKEIYYDREFETALLNFREIVSTIFNKKSIALWLMTGSLAFLILFRILNIINVANPLANKIFKIGEDGILIPLIPSIFFWVIEIIKKAKLKLKIGRFDSDEQFENKFIELVKKDKSKKIIFIDDLDRCSKEKVVKALETIKTFLDVETCIFIIACDDEIIKKAINKSKELYENGNNEGAEYLEKFFQYTLRIPPVLKPDMRKFILNLLKKNNSDLIKLGETLEDIIFITINNNIKSPRNAITALNEFSASYVLASQREASSSARLHEKKITDNLPILAIVTSIRSYFPDFYNDMIKNSDIIFWIKDILEGNQGQLNEKQLKICESYFQHSEEESDKAQVEKIKNQSNKDILLESVEWNKPKEECRGLLAFIESIKNYLTIRDITPFLYIGVDTTSYLIGDESLQDFNEAMKNGIETRITKIIDEADQTKTEHLFDHMLNWIDEKLEGIEQKKALQILSKLLHKCPKALLHRASRVFYSKFYKKSISYSEYTKYSQEGIFISANALSGTNQKNLIKQSIDFLGCVDNDISYDKLILHQIFKYESLVNNNALVEKVSAFLEKRKKVVKEGEAEEMFESLDFLYIKKIIIDNAENIEVIRKFFSGKIVDEVINSLIELDKQEEVDKEAYNEIIEVFEILKLNILDKDLHELCKAYKLLITTKKYYLKILIDIENRANDLPFDELNDLAISILKELKYITDSSGVNRVLNLCKVWYGKHKELKDDSVNSEVLTQLIGLFQRDDDNIIYSAIEFTHYFVQFFKKEDIETINSQIILLIKPQEDYKKALKLKELLVFKDNFISSQNRVEILNMLVSDLNAVSGLQNQECYDFWVEFLNEIVDEFDESELGVLIKPNNNQFVLNVNFPEVNNDLRSKYCELITKRFEKLNTPKQNEFFELFNPFLSTNTKAHAEYSINELYKIKSYLKDSPFISSSTQHLINQFNVEIEPEIKFKNIQLLFLYQELLNPQQKNIVLDNFVNIVSSDPTNTLEFLVNIWDKITDGIKYASITNLLPTNVLSENNNNLSILDKIYSDFEQLEDEQSIAYISQREENFKNTVTERDFYASLINKISSLINSSTKAQIKGKTINEIRIEADIDSCRNKMSTLIAIKENEYEKDTEINDMFFSLLNDNLDKKKLAIDVFEYYYEVNHPHKRKGALEERFNNLMDEMDSEHKKILKSLASKYSLNVKKSFWDSLFGQ